MKDILLGAVFVEWPVPLALEINGIRQNHPRVRIKWPLDNFLDFSARAGVRPFVDDLGRFGFSKIHLGQFRQKYFPLLETNPGCK